MPKGVGRPVLEPRGLHGRRPVVSTPAGVVQVATTLAGKQQRAKLLRIGTAATRAALEQADGERKALEQSLADGAVERDELKRQLAEYRDKLHASEFLRGQLTERTSELHALATRELQT
jgi:hypothetical protein